MSLKPITPTLAQAKIVKNALNTLGLLSRDPNLPQVARETLRSTHKALQEVMRDLGISKRIEGGVSKANGVEHEWPNDETEKWEALK